MRVVHLALLTVLLLGIGSDSVFANERFNSAESGQQIANWTRTLQQIEEEIAQPFSSNKLDSELRKSLEDLRVKANRANEIAESSVQEYQASLDALGAVPEQGEESTDIAKERGVLQGKLREISPQTALTELALTRVKNLIHALTERERNQFVTLVSTRGPLPVDWQTAKAAVKDFSTLLTAVSTIPRTWWQQLPDQHRDFKPFVGIVITLAVGIGLAWQMRRLLITRFGAYPTEEVPSYNRRVMAAFADAAGSGLIPAAFLLAIYVRTQSPNSVLDGEFGNVVAICSAFGIVFLLATALPHAILSPEAPQWRLTHLSNANGLKTYRLICILATLFCLNMLPFAMTGGDNWAEVLIPSLQNMMTPELVSIWALFFNTAEGLLILSLLRPSLWAAQASQPESDSAADREPQLDSPQEPDSNEDRLAFWHLLHLAVSGMTVAGIFAPIIGYANLSNYFIGNLVWTVIIVSSVYIARGLLRELVGYIASSHTLRDTLGMPHRTRSQLKLWSRVLLDIVLISSTILILAPDWGVPQGDLISAMQSFLAGFTIGSFTLSPADLFMSILTFFLVLALSGTLQRTLAQRILPQTEIEEGVQHSITTGIKYLGFLLATVIAVTVVGFDLSNIAIIAGALSVGIGFGLQNIVNNFVSGLILLIERPVKVGDWVVIGQNEGFVKEVNMRATEIETWQRASVIVPNADIISNSLTNWTHKNKVGRVDVKVGVALDADPDQIRAILLECAHAHPRLVHWPEPVVMLLDFAESRLEFELRGFTNDIVWVLIIASELRFEILNKFKQVGIQIPYPQRMIHLAESVPASASAPDHGQRNSLGPNYTENV